MSKVCIIDGLRTPFVKAGKELREYHPKTLGTANLKEFLYKMSFSGDEIDEVILGNTLTLADSSNIARVISLQAGLNEKIPASTVNKNCASSMESFAIGLSKIQNKLCDSVIVGGVESMSYAPFMLSMPLSRKIQNFFLSKNLKQKWSSLISFRAKDFKIFSPILEGLKDPLTGYSMGETAELLAREFHISRSDQDDFAIQSHKKAWAKQDILKEEIFPFFTETEKVERDMGIRPKISKQRISRMSGFFDKKYGTVTIANSCPINDGSSVLLIMSEEKSSALGQSPLARVKSSAFAGLDPKRMGLGPVYASHLALKKAGLSLKDIGLIEINEAFSAQVLACLKAFESKKFAEEKLHSNTALGEINPEILNVNGGAIAIGHPISATGTRLILTLAKEMKRRKVQFGLATLCIGGGQGGAVILEQAS